jgi:hypothetical protein
MQWNYLLALQVAPRLLAMYYSFIAQNVEPTNAGVWQWGLGKQSVFPESQGCLMM